MQLNAETKIDALLQQYPFLLDFLVAQAPMFKNLKNPLMRKTVGKFATLGKAAAIAGLDVDDLLQKIQAEIEKKNGPETAGEKPAPDFPMAAPQDQKKREALLKEIIADLHAGHDVDSLKDRFRQAIGGIDASEIAKIEQTLMDEGLPAEEIKRLCNVHVEIFKEALAQEEPIDPPPGHPLHTYMKENRVSEEIISKINLVIGQLGHPPTAAAFETHKDELKVLVARLSEIDLHYTRKENQLFSMLENHDFTGPSQVMWAIHDDIRAHLKTAREAIAQADVDRLVASLKDAGQEIRDMIFKEELILYPASLDMLSEKEFIEMKKGEAEIGFAWVEPDKGWPDDTSPMPAEAESGPMDFVKDVVGALGLKTGRMTLEQINLVLTHLPVDLTFVDEFDRVAFYSEGPERIFPRSPAIIGREVRNCHPPKSVHMVNKILDAFKSGTKKTAGFWLELQGRFIYIRYFAVFDDQGLYKGTLEVSQDLTEIRNLKGERRLVDWD